MSWDPEQYLSFAGQRARPFRDLVERIAVGEPSHVVDLGCGPGTMTVTLAQRWPTAAILGVDSSPEMIESARSLQDQRVRFELGVIETWRPDAQVDVIVSNATLQWVPSHRELLPGWVRTLRPGGALAFQVPSMSGSPAGNVFTDVARAPRWVDRLGSITGPTVASGGNTAVPPIGEYVAQLAELGCRVDAWETVYQHVLAGDDPVLEWFAGTGLRPFLAALSEAERPDFRAEVAARLREAYPRNSWGTVLPFRRVFVIAYV